MPEAETPAPVENHPCEQCGQLDDHPMIHVMDLSYHFDCLPHRYIEQLAGEPQHAVTLAAIEAAKDGIHGDDLRTHIASLPDDNSLPDLEA